MNNWVLPACVNKNSDYYHEIDRALETLKKFSSRERIDDKNIRIVENERTTFELHKFN